MKSNYNAISRIFLLLLCVSVSTGIMACGDATTGSQTTIQYPEGTGGITVSLEFPFDESDHTVTRGLSDFCPEWGDPTVSFEVRASDDSTLLKYQEFTCSHDNGRGTVSGIPVGSGRILYVGIFGEDGTLFTARVTGIQVNAGQTTDIGSVEMIPQSSGLLKLANTENASESINVVNFRHRLGEFTFNWNELGDDVLSPGNSLTFSFPQGDYSGRICWESSGCSYLDFTIREGEVYDLVVAPSTDTLKPTAPTDLLAWSLSSSEIELDWEKSEDNVGVEGYRIYRDGVEIDTTQNTYYKDTGLSADTYYCYTVVAYDAAGNASDASDEDCDTTDALGCGTGLPLVIGDLNFPSSVYSDSVESGSMAYQGSFEDINNPLVIIKFSTSGSTHYAARHVPIPAASNCRIDFPVYIPDSVSGTVIIYFRLIDYDDTLGLSDNFENNSEANELSQMVDIFILVDIEL